MEDIESEFRHQSKGDKIWVQAWNVLRFIHKAGYVLHHRVELGFRYENNRKILRIVFGC